MADAVVCYTLTGGVARITLCDRRRGNLLNARSLGAISAYLQEAARTSECRVVILEAQTDADFCRGLDLEWMLSGPSEGPHLFHTCLCNIAECPQPVIARITGQITGGGLGLVAACDLAIAEQGASFQLSEVVVGMIPALIAPFLLTRLSASRLKALALSSRRLQANEAWQWGLVDVVTDDLERTIGQQIKRFLHSSPAALATTKRYLQQTPTEEHLALARNALQDWLVDPEHREAIQTFADGFAPPWFAVARNGHG
jgi:enoyl-CoA hydratase/carnithine racemase